MSPDHQNVDVKGTDKLYGNKSLHASSVGQRQGENGSSSSLTSVLWENQFQAVFLWQLDCRHPVLGRIRWEGQKGVAVMRPPRCSFTSLSELPILARGEVFLCRDFNGKFDGLAKSLIHLSSKGLLKKLKCLAPYESILCPRLPMHFSACPRISTSA